MEQHRSGCGRVRWIGAGRNGLEHTGGYAPEEAVRVARSLLRDVLRYEPRRTASYPGNGRALSDDVMDVFIAVITNGKITEDKVGPHDGLLAGLPTSVRDRTARHRVRKRKRRSASPQPNASAVARRF